VDWKKTRTTDAIALAACITVVVTGLVLGSSRSIANYGNERDFYDTWAPRADAPFDLGHYSRGENELGYPLFRNHPPGYSLLVAAGNTFTGDSFRTAVILSAIAAGLFGWISYLLLVALFDTQRALAGTILFLIAIIPFSFVASTDLVGGLTIVLPMWILLRKVLPGTKDLVLAGVLAGAAYLVRSQAIFLLVGFLVVIPILEYTRAGRAETPGRAVRWRDALWQGVFVVAGFLAATGPWLFLNWKLNGDPMYSTAHLQVAVHYWDALRETTQTAYWRAAEQFHSMGQVVLFDPVGFVRRYVKNVLINMPRSIGVDVLGYPGFFLFGAGFVFLLASMTARRFSWLAILMFGYLLLGLVNIVGRYFVFLYPVLFFTVAYVAFAPFVMDQFRRLRIPAGLGGWALVACVALLMLRDVRRDTHRYLEAEPRYLLELTETLRERAEPGDRVMVHEPHIPYLSGLEMAVVRGGTVEAIIEDGRSRGVRFYVYDRIEATEWPARAGLANPAKVPPELQPIYVHQPTGTILYELVSDADR
jgi:hypothetical protein